MKAAAPLLPVLLILGVLGLTGAAGWMVVHAATVLRALGIAAVGAYLVNPLVRRLQNRGMPRDLAIAAVFVGFLSVLAVAAFLVAPVLQQQAESVSAQVEQFLAASGGHVERVQAWLGRRLPAGLLAERNLKQEFDARVHAAAQQSVRLVTAFAIGAASQAVYLILLPMMVFFLLRDGPTFLVQLLRAVPNRYLESAQRLLHRTDEQLGGYIRGVLVVSLCVGIVDTIGLWLCDLRYFFVVGPLMGLLNIVPIFGSIAGIVLAALAMVLQTAQPSSVLGPIVVGLTAQALENAFFTPIAVSRSVSLHPLAVLVATLAGGELFGLVGLLLAVPCLATVKVVWQVVQESRQRPQADMG